MSVIRITILAPTLWQDLLAMFVARCPELELSEANPDVLLLAGRDWSQRMQPSCAEGEHPPRVVLVTAGGRDEILSARRHGVNVFVGDQDRPLTLQEAVHAAFRGEPYCSPDLAMKIMDQSDIVALLRAPRQAALQNELSEQQCLVVHYAIQGLTNAQIGSRMHLSTATVRYHLKRACDHLGATRRVQLGDLIHRHPPHP